MLNDLAIAIPVYNQPELLDNCLNSLSKQQAFTGKVYLFDDCSVKSYSEVIKKYNSLNVINIRNEKNLGALPNMQHSFNEIARPHNYVMVMHEDDLLLNGFFKTIAEAIALTNKKPSLILSCYSNFTSETICNLKNDFSKSDFKWIKKKGLAKLFLQIHPIAFGSAIYDSGKYKTMDLDFDQFGEFADRPFLLGSLEADDDILLIESPLYGYRSHDKNDTRWKLLNVTHVFNLLNLFKSIIAPVTKDEIKEYKKKEAHFLIESYSNLQLTGNYPNRYAYLLKSLFTGHLSIKYALLKNHAMNHFFTALRKRI